MADRGCTRGRWMKVFSLRPVLLLPAAFILTASLVEGQQPDSGSSGSTSSVGELFARLIGFSLITGLWVFAVIIVLAAICGCCLIKLMVAAIGALVTRNKYKNKGKSPVKNADVVEKGKGQEVTRYEELGIVPPNADYTSLEKHNAGYNDHYDEVSPPGGPQDAATHEYLSMSPTGAEYERRDLGTSDDYLRPAGY